MNTFKVWNRYFGWVIFLVALLTYGLTVEPTASFWDAGEYIATSAKLQVGHPPGAPLFQMLGAFFAMFALSPRNLPNNNVLFVSNHQTYFADVVAMFHVFNASLSGRVDSIKNVGYLWNPKLNIYFIAARETMRSGILPRVLAYAGSVSIDRTWREKGKEINRQVKMKDISNIGLALDDGWVITFPQGTTTPFKPLRKGTAHIIKQYKPVVVPLVID